MDSVGDPLAEKTEPVSTMEKLKKAKRRSSFGRPRNNIGFPSETLEHDVETVDQQLTNPQHLFDETASSKGVNRNKLRFLQNYSKKLELEHQNWLRLMTQLEERADASQQLCYNGEMTIDSDDQCLIDVDEKYRSVVENVPDYEAVVSSFEEFDMVNALGGDIAMKAVGCLKMLQRQYGIKTQDRINALSSSAFPAESSNQCQ